MQRENQYVVKKEVVAVKDTLLNLPVGKEIAFDCREFAPYPSVQSAISRLNKFAGSVVYSSSSKDNGATYIVIRNK